MKKQITLSESEIVFLKNNMGTSKYALSILKKLLKQRIKTSSAKAKGRNLQKWVCEKLATLIGINYDQSDDQCMIHSREMGQRNVDIVLRDRAADLLPYSIECKNTEKLNVNETIEQAKSNQKDGTDWLIVYKRNGMKQPVVIIDWCLFEKFVRLFVSEKEKALMKNSVKALK
jgi:hypothetical protein